jgi:choline-sulfatase
MLTRREFLGTAPAVLTQGARRPNVVVFMTDQESALLPGRANLPNRERLNARGVRFTHAFTNTPQCSAARSSLLTGLEPHRTGVVTNVDDTSLGKPLSPELPTVGKVFRDAGYRTGYFGKWHLGAEEGSLEAFGFSKSVRGRDRAVADAAAAWMRAQSKPWLAWVSILNPHDITGFARQRASVIARAGVPAPVTGLENLAGKPSEQRAFMDIDDGRPALNYKPEDWIRYRSYYLELMEKVDECLGAVMSAIEDWNNTVFLYTSDHGDALGEHGLPFKGPFMYEPLLRIPLVICAPGLKPAERDDLAASIDVAPTVASLAGLRWPAKVTGRDLSHGPTGREAVLLEYYAKQKWINPIRTIRTRRWKLNWYDSGNQELYDLREDPNETRNLAADPAALKTRRELEDRLNAWRAPLTRRG